MSCGLVTDGLDEGERAGQAASGLRFAHLPEQAEHRRWVDGGGLPLAEGAHRAVEQTDDLRVGQLLGDPEQLDEVVGERVEVLVGVRRDDSVDDRSAPTSDREVTLSLRLREAVSLLGEASATQRRDLGSELGQALHLGEEALELR